MTDVSLIVPASNPQQQHQQHAHQQQQAAALAMELFAASPSSSAATPGGTGAPPLAPLALTNVISGGGGNGAGGATNSNSGADSATTAAAAAAAASAANAAAAVRGLLLFGQSGGQMPGASPSGAGADARAHSHVSQPAILFTHSSSFKSSASASASSSPAANTELPLVNSALAHGSQPAIAGANGAGGGSGRVGGGPGTGAIDNGPPSAASIAAAAIAAAMTAPLNGGDDPQSQRSRSSQQLQRDYEAQQLHRQQQKQLQAQHSSQQLSSRNLSNTPGTGAAAFGTPAPPPAGTLLAATPQALTPATNTRGMESTPQQHHTLAPAPPPTAQYPQQQSSAPPYRNPRNMRDDDDDPQPPLIAQLPAAPVPAAPAVQMQRVTRNTPLAPLPQTRTVAGNGNGTATIVVAATAPLPAPALSIPGTIPNRRRPHRHANGNRDGGGDGGSDSEKDEDSDRYDPNQPATTHRVPRVGGVLPLAAAAAASGVDYDPYGVASGEILTPSKEEEQNSGGARAGGRNTNRAAPTQRTHSGMTPTPGLSAAGQTLYAKWNSKMKLFRSLLIMSGLHQRTSVAYRTFLRIILFGCALLCILNMGFRTRSYHNPLFDLGLGCVHVWLAVAYEYWSAYLQTPEWTALMNICTRHRGSNFLKSVHRIGVIGCIFVSLLSILIYMGWVVPIWAEVYWQWGDSPDKGRFYWFLFVHALVMTILIVPWVCVCFCSWILFYLSVSAHKSDITVFEDFVTALFTTSINATATAAAAAGPAGAAASGVMPLPLSPHAAATAAAIAATPAGVAPMSVDTGAGSGGAAAAAAAAARRSGDSSVISADAMWSLSIMRHKPLRDRLMFTCSYFENLFFSFTVVMCLVVLGSVYDFNHALFLPDPHEQSFRFRVWDYFQDIVLLYPLTKHQLPLHASLMQYFTLCDHSYQVYGWPIDPPLAIGVVKFVFELTVIMLFAVWIKPVTDSS